LAVGGLIVACEEPLPPRTPVEVKLRLADCGETDLRAEVVAPMPGGLALHFEGDPEGVLATLRAAPEPEDDEGTRATLWEKLRDMTPPQKILLAPKADRVTRALLVQESDPQVLFALLKNPRLSIDEVVRVAKSSFLSFQGTELILKTNPWFSNLDVRLALVHNPRTPLPFALRILQTLPDREVRLIAKGAATSMALKQAALRKVQGG
ncbi:MAG: hypothetical protein KDB94_05815, partial [Acidobacteria bacterium]|nr:hypothetical protein [Acidobacteriota bacterium]